MGADLSPSAPRRQSDEIEAQRAAVAMQQARVRQAELDLRHAEMTSRTPARLNRLLAADSPESQERAWKEWVEAFSKILIRASRNGASSYDDTMDRYAFVLERLKEKDFRRLRSYSEDGPSQFTTWLFVVARRLSIDHHRQAFGRVSRRPGSSEAECQEPAPRYRLVRLLTEELDPDRMPDPEGPDPETRAWLTERREALEDALDTLEPRDRLLLTLRYVDDVPVRKISAIMGFQSPFQAYRRLKKNLERLREELENRGIAEP